MFTRLIPSLLVGLALVFALSSCSKNDKSKTARPVFRSQIPLQDVVASEGCLSLPKLFSQMKTVDPGRASVVVPTAISFESAAGIREDFRRLIAYGQLVVAHQPMSASVDLPEVAQEGCTKVTTTAPDGVTKDFTVKNSARDSLMAEAEDGERLEYSWISPQTVQSRHRYAAFDQPCNGSDKPVLVTVGKVIDWSDSGVPAEVPATGSTWSIDSEFISLASAAVGESADSVYDQAAADGARRIDLDKVNALTAKPPRPEVVSCGGVVEPTPAPTPDPDPNAPAPDPNNPSPTPDPNHPVPSPLDPNNPSPDHPHGDDTPGPNH